MPMPHFAYVVRALSPRDGGWVRWSGYHKSEEQAWKIIILLWDMRVMAGDYTTLEVKKTIVLR